MESAQLDASSTPLRDASEPAPGSTLNPGAVARGWGVEPALLATGRAHPVQVSVIRTHWTRDREIVAPRDPATHLLCVHLAGGARLEHFVNGHRRFRGRVQRGAVNVIRAGDLPRGVIGDGRTEVVHVYLPQQVLRDAVAGLDLDADRLELIEPAYAGDAVLAALGNAIAAAEADRGHLPGLLDGISQAICARLLSRWTTRGDTYRRAIDRGGVVLPEWRLRRVEEYVRAHLGSRDVGVATLAKIAGLSPFHFSRAFARATGETPHRYVLRVRLAHAQALLRDAPLSIAGVAALCGFRNSSHFGRTFREYVGTTPSEFRAFTRVR